MSKTLWFTPWETYSDYSDSLDGHIDHMLRLREAIPREHRKSASFQIEGGNSEESTKTSVTWYREQTVEEVAAAKAKLAGERASAKEREEQAERVVYERLKKKFERKPASLSDELIKCHPAIKRIEMREDLKCVDLDGPVGQVTATVDPDDEPTRRAANAAMREVIDRHVPVNNRIEIYFRHALKSEPLAWRQP